MTSYIMVIDQGTTSTHAVLFDKASNIVRVAQKGLENYYPYLGWVEQNVDNIWASTIGAMFEVLVKAGVRDTQVAAINITNQRETTVVWDRESGQPIYFAIVWQSRQSNTYCRKLKEQGLEGMIREKTGLLLDPYFSTSKIRWILDHVEGAQAHAGKGELLLGTMDIWLLWKLTKGVKYMSNVSNASRAMLMNLETLQYDEELLKLWNTPRYVLPEIRDFNEVYGVTSGVSDHPVPVTALIGDQQAALFGQTCFDAENAKDTYGASCFLLVNTKERPIHFAHGLVSCVGWRIRGGTDYALEGSVFITGAAIQWFHDGLKILYSSAESEQHALQVADSDGIYVVPSFTGLGTPYWKPRAKGGIFGLTRDTTQEHIIHAALEVLAYQTNDVLQVMKQDSGLDIAQMQVDGGISRSDYLLQFQSDITDTCVVRPTISETTTLGAAYLSGLVMGFRKSEGEIRSQFQVSWRFTPQMDAQ